MTTVADIEPPQSPEPAPWTIVTMSRRSSRAISLSLATSFCSGGGENDSVLASSPRALVRDVLGPARVKGALAIKMILSPGPRQRAAHSIFLRSAMRGRRATERAGPRDPRGAKTPVAAGKTSRMSFGGSEAGGVGGGRGGKKNTKKG